MERISFPRVRPSGLLVGIPALDRVEVFRRLFLLFALGSMAGMGAAIALEDQASLTRVVLMAGPFLALAWGWILWHRRGSFPRWTLPLEALLLVAFMSAMRDPWNWVGVCYSAATYRATFGSRGRAREVSAAFAVAYLIGLGLVSGTTHLLHPITLVYLLAIGFGAYVSATLVEILRRDTEQVNELSASGDALRESEQRLRSVADCLREALLITDTEDRIILANSRVKHVLGYEPHEVIGKVAAELLLPAHQRNAFSDRIRRRLGGETELYEVELLRKDGRTMFAEISASPYRDHQGRIIGTLGAISDVTDRKLLEERLRQSTRLEAVGQLAGGVAHDFNNLLTVIKCHTELMLDAHADPRSVRDSVVEIDRAVDKGAALIQQLLAFSRRQLLQPRRVVLARAVADASESIRHILRGGVELVVCPGDATEVFADPAQIDQVLAGLVRNAQEAMPGGGRIVVETRTRVLRRDDPRVLAQEAVAGAYGVLVVSDNGSGMNEDVRKHVFEPFFTTKEPGEGTGLGLASMYGIVRQSGGFMDVESTPRLGTTFRVYLPAMSPEPRAGETRAPQLQST